MSNKHLAAKIISTIAGQSWLVIAPDEFSVLVGIGGTLLAAKEKSDISVNQVIFSAGPVNQSEPDSNLSVTSQALGINRCYWLVEEEISYCPELRKKLERILSYSSVDSLLIPFLLNQENSRTNEIIWQLIQDIAFKGEIYAYETGLSSYVNRLIDVTSTIADKQHLIEQYDQANNKKFAEVVLAGNRARTISLDKTESNDGSIEYIEAFYLFEKSCNKQLFDTINHLSPIYLSEKQVEQQPLISVIIRTMNRPDLLKQAIDSVVAQNYPNIELIIVNDGGIDVWPQIQQARHQLTYVNYQNLESNIGRASAANIGLQQVKGDYALFLDDDDLIDIDHISALNHAMQNNMGFDVVYSGIRVSGSRVFNSSFNKNFLQVYNYIPIHAVLFSRKFIEMGCRFDKTLGSFEDWDFWIQLSQYGDFYHLNRLSGDYRNLGDSDGGTFAMNTNVALNRYKVLTKWRSRWSIEQFDAIINTLRHFPTARENELNKNLEHKKTQYAELEKKHSGLIQQFNRQTEEIKHKASHIVNIETQLSALQESNKNTHLVLSATQDQLKAAQDKFKVILDQLKSTEQQFSQLLNSKIWRMTSPLRKILNTLYKVKQ